MIMKLKILLSAAAAAVLVTGTAHAADDNNNAVMHGIDVSKYQREIDWDEVSKNVNFAIIRCGYGSDLRSQDDEYWKRNADECTRLGIPFGVYLYSYADTVEKAESEAEHVLRLVDGYDLSFPIYYDIEDELHKELTEEELGDIAKAFCDKIEAAGYEVGIYSYKYFWDQQLTAPVFDTASWFRWVAQISDKCTYSKPFTMWQYTFEGEVDGIAGNVDMDYWYGEQRGTAEAKPTAAPTPAPTAAPTPAPTAAPSPTPTPAASAAPAKSLADIFRMSNYGDYVEVRNTSDDTYRVRVIINSYDKGKLINSKSHDLTFIGGKKQRFKMYRGNAHKVFIYSDENGLTEIFN